MADNPQKFKVILNGQELQTVDYSGTFKVFYRLNSFWKAGTG